MLEEKIRTYMNIHAMTQPGDAVLVALSGGADSVALLLLLHALSGEKELHLEAIHVEHGIRGAESHRDADFARQLCQELQIPFHLVHVDVPAYCSSHHLGTEEAARILRYEAFEQVAERISRKEKGDSTCRKQKPEDVCRKQTIETGGQKQNGRDTEAKSKEHHLPASGISLALAHHMDDNAETILFQEIRGSGLKGLCGMQPVREEKLRKIRPLLGVTRQEIEVYLLDKGQPYCVDSTNLELDYSRNRLRHQVLPVLKEINSRAVEHIGEGARQLQMIWEFMELQVDQAYNELVQSPNHLHQMEKSRNAANAMETVQKSEASYGADAVRNMNCTGTREEMDRWALDLTGFATLHPAVQSSLLMRLLEQIMGSRRDLGMQQVDQLLSLAEGQSGKQIMLAGGWSARKNYERLFFQREPEEDKVPEEEEWMILLPADLKEPVEILVPGGRFLLQKKAFSGDMAEIPKNTYTKWFEYAIVKNGLVLRHRRPGDYLVIDAAGHRKKLQNYLVDSKIPEKRRDELILLATGEEILWVTGGRTGWQGRVSKETTIVLEISYMEE